MSLELHNFAKFSSKKWPFYFKKKVNHGMNGKTHNSYDLSVPCFNDSKEGIKICISVN